MCYQKEVEIILDAVSVIMVVQRGQDEGGENTGDHEVREVIQVSVEENLNSSTATNIPTESSDEDDLFESSSSEEEIACLETFAAEEKEVNELILHVATPSSHLASVEACGCPSHSTGHNPFAGHTANVHFSPEYHFTNGIELPYSNATWTNNNNNNVGIMLPQQQAGFPIAPAHHFNNNYMEFHPLQHSNGPMLHGGQVQLVPMPMPAPIFNNRQFALVGSHVGFPMPFQTPPTNYPIGNPNRMIPTNQQQLQRVWPTPNFNVGQCSQPLPLPISGDGVYSGFIPHGNGQPLLPIANSSFLPVPTNVLHSMDGGTRCTQILQPFPNQWYCNNNNEGHLLSTNQSFSPCFENVAFPPPGDNSDIQWVMNNSDSDMMTYPINTHYSGHLPTTSLSSWAPSDSSGSRRPSTSGSDCSYGSLGHDESFSGNNINYSASTSAVGNFSDVVWSPTDVSNRVKIRTMTEDNLILSQNGFIVDDRVHVNMHELSYVDNTFDVTGIKQFPAPPPSNLEYYVPPSVDDSDFFGGQQYLWQAKMFEHFGILLPDIWRLQGAPQFNINPDDGWVGLNITTKLRFCCRSCSTPWTSKQGKILFAFKQNKDSRRGFIFMKIFGQICMNKQRKPCRDENYQQPACYPEEIERAMKRLLEFVCNQFYGIALPEQFLNDCKKSIRLSNTRSSTNNHHNLNVENHHHHRKDLCQACRLNICF